jgi:hypothetical protein
MTRWSGAFKIHEIEETMLKAWMLRPWRCEPIFQLAVIYKDSQRWEQAYQLFKSCATMEYPHRDLLFVSAALYEGASIDEFSVACYWTGRHQECVKSCEKLLEGDYGKIHKARIMKNVWFSEKQLGVFSTDRLLQFADQEKKEIKETFNVKQLSLDF